ncbi:DUF397 domain-containing protein [Streptomyces sp. NPDC057900]|uniref:DUF397 domain-containing protein n=1 Tax=Streptomyces sp. NPDC057900 TaxID=3346274 RepID=UPI0036EFFFE0
MRYGLVPAQALTPRLEVLPTLTRFSGCSSNDGPACVEIAAAPATVHVRDSKNIPGLELGFTPGAWAEFVSYASTD